MIALPKEPDAALLMAALHLAANDDALDPRDVVDACASEIEARGGAVSEPGRCAALLRVRDHARERTHRSFAELADRVERKGKLTGEMAEMAERSRAHLRAIEGGASPKQRAGASHMGSSDSSATAWRPLDIRPRLRFVDFDADSTVAPPAWLVKGLVPKVGISLLYGESSAGKTFLAIHLALCTAWGLPFFGMRVKQGGVVYVAAESGAGVLVRLKAAQAKLAPAIAAENLVRKSEGQRPLKRAGLRVITEAPNLGPSGDPKPLMATIEDAKVDMTAAGLGLSLAIVDTWHAALGGGDDNTSTDTGTALRPLRELCELHGLATMIVAHPGKDPEKGVRGSSALPAAADAIIALTVDGHTGPKAKPSSATRRLSVTKMRDGECGMEAAYRLAVVDLGVDADGDPWNTCVVEPLGGVQQAEPGAPRLSGQARELVGLLSGLANSGGHVNLDTARQSFIASAREAKPDGAESAPRTAWDRAVKKLQDAGRIEVFATENRIRLLDLTP